MCSCIYVTFRAKLGVPVSRLHLVSISFCRHYRLGTCNCQESFSKTYAVFVLSVTSKSYFTYVISWYIAFYGGITRKWFHCSYNIKAQNRKKYIARNSFRERQSSQLLILLFNRLRSACCLIRTMSRKEMPFCKRTVRMSSQLKGCKWLGYTAFFLSIRLKVFLPRMEINYLLPVKAEEAKVVANIQCLLYQDKQQN